MTNGRWFDETVADAADGGDVGGISGIVAEGSAQGADVHVDDPVVAVSGWARCPVIRPGAVRRGLAITGRTITAAAAIMILVFGSFIPGSDTVIKQFGFGLAVAVLVDAFIIRMAIVPALMFLLGRSNWWFPAMLDRALPSLGAESLEELPAKPTEPADV
jgi:uncharacterized membrane protein YdfJ with MMPL/SSD domain